MRDTYTRAPAYLEEVYDTRRPAGTYLFLFLVVLYHMLVPRRSVQRSHRNLRTYSGKGTQPSHSTDRGGNI